MPSINRLIRLVVPALAMAPVAAQAQFAVIDQSNLAKAIETARNTLTLIDREEQQLAEAQKLYEAGNRITDIGNIAGNLNTQFLQRGIPDDIRNVADLASADLADLGSIGQRAQQLLTQLNYSTSEGALPPTGASSAARDQAIAENGLVVAEQTSQGLGELKTRLISAQTEKEVADLQARATLEVAQLLNQANQQTALRQAQLAAQRQSDLANEAARRRKSHAAITEGRILPRLSQ